MPTVYGFEHFAYLFVSLLILVPTFLWIKKHVHTEKEIRKTIFVLGAILFVAIIWNRISVCALRDGFDKFIPSTFCGMSSLLLSISAMTLKKDHAVFHSVAYVGLLGGLLTNIYPDFIGQAPSIFYPMTISGLVHHTLMVFLVIVMFSLGYVRPSIKKWIYLPLGLAVYMCIGIFLMTELGYSDAMYIYSPILSGTPLNWFWLGMIFLPYHALFLLVWERARRQVSLKRVTV